MSCIHDIFKTTGMSNIWLDQNFYSVKWISASINQKLKDKGFFFFFTKMEQGYQQLQ